MEPASRSESKMQKMELPTRMEPAWLVPGIHVESDAWVVYAVTAAILALLNAILLPVLKTLSCGLIILTL